MHAPEQISDERLRMAPFTRLPIFLSLSGKRAVVAGDNAAAAWKVELLSAAGAEVDVFAPKASEELLTTLARPPGGRIVHHTREWDAADLADAALAVGAFEDDHAAARFAQAAQAANIPFNVIDKPDFCSFIFGAIVNRSPLMIGISTDGAAPVFAQAIRARIEALLPTGFAHWAQAAHTWRQFIKRSGLSFGGRWRFWQLFAARAIANPNRAPDNTDFDLLLSEARAQAARHEHGSVALVGTGPGDPELLTLRAARVLRSADVILFDTQIAPEILDFSRREARKMLVRATNHGEPERESRITALAVTFAKGGKRVVRLVAGDPAQSSEVRREIADYQGAGIALELVPGLAWRTSPHDDSILALLQPLPGDQECSDADQHARETLL
jgi:uroporphyrin-III C-methyltransferase / precorrin-2 dehydrogenase / sirohydrochlorin ferrochelatase